MLPLCKRWLLNNSQESRLREISHLPFSSAESHQCLFPLWTVVNAAIVLMSAPNILFQTNAGVRLWSAPTADRTAHFWTKPAALNFSHMFIQQFRKYVSRHIGPMSDANVLMGLVLLHFGPFHKHVNWLRPEQCEKCGVKRNYRCESTHRHRSHFRMANCNFSSLYTILGLAFVDL